ncbi:MAG: exopolysaccharide biosynthesis protein [Candidatus Saccharibacteria bacterium]|nr:exopolysaccharide biosynthesis protein [Candidatus Saccharibacteria bacterium]
MTKQLFSKTLNTWLSSPGKKTIGSMLDIFDEKSFAFIFLVLMIFPAAPLPTGGLVHVFEVIVILLSLQLIIGRGELWLPQKLKRVELDSVTRKKVLPFLERRVKFFEKFAKPRLASTIGKKWFRVQLGIFITLFTLGAFFAPPFTGLDTLPSLGVVLIAIGVILDDIIPIIAGYIVGFAGLAVAFILGAGIVAGIQALF